MWKDALKPEFKNKTDLGTWELVQLPKGEKLPEPNGYLTLSVMKNIILIYLKSAYLVAKVFLQMHRIDYYAVFSPVLEYATLQLMFGCAAVFKWERKLINVKNAFINWKLIEKMYVGQPYGFVQKRKEDLVYIFRKALYILRQSSWEWHKHLHKFCIGTDCNQCMAYVTLYVLMKNGNFSFHAVYVDDILLFAEKEYV